MSRINTFTVTITFLVMCVTLSLAATNKYCDVCENHTMCLYKGLGEKCKDAGGSGVTEDEKNYILNAHNSLRSRVALGQEGRGKGGPQKKAANMMKLSWDSSLAEVAQRWADQCNFGHDTCRDDPRWQVGQNVFWKHKYPNHKVNWTEAITAWYNEVDLFDPKSIDSFLYDGATGHYTQLMWHDTQYVGCGRRDYGYSKLYVCNYGPAGNWIDEPVYKTGEPCSKCPDKTVCSNGLCANPFAQNETVIDVTTTTGGITEYSNNIIENESKPEFRFEHYNEILLDAETLGAIEKMKNEIINLVKTTVRKTKLQNQIK